MAARRIEVQAGQVGAGQGGVARRILGDVDRRRIGKAPHFVDTLRVALLGHEQATAGGIKGQSLEALVAVAANAESQTWRPPAIDRPRPRVDRDMHQRLPSFVGQHEFAGADILDGFRIAHPAQRDVAQHIAAQR